MPVRELNQERKDEINKRRRERRKNDKEYRERINRQSLESRERNKEKIYKQRKEKYKSNKQNKEWLDKQRKRQRISMKKRIDHWKSISRVHGNQCSKCGAHAALEWHHIEKSTKEFSIGRFQEKISEENEKIFLGEIGKCVCLCRFCHRLEMPQTNINNSRFSIRRAASHVNSLKRNLACRICERQVFEREEHAFDFDHVDRKEKSLEISYMVRTGYANEKIDAEITKCQMLCANCHFSKTMMHGDHIARKSDPLVGENPG